MTAVVITVLIVLLVGLALDSQPKATATVLEGDLYEKDGKRYEVIKIEGNKVSYKRDTYVKTRTRRIHKDDLVDKFKRIK